MTADRSFMTIQEKMHVHCVNKEHKRKPTQTDRLQVQGRITIAVWGCRPHVSDNAIQLYRFIEFRMSMIVFTWRVR